LDLVCASGTDEDETVSMFLALQSSPHTSFLMNVTQYKQRWSSNKNINKKKLIARIM